MVPRPVDVDLFRLPFVVYCPWAVEAIPFQLRDARFTSPAPRSRSWRCWRAAAQKTAAGGPDRRQGESAVRDVLRDLPWRRPERLRRRQRPVVADREFLATASDAFLRAAITRGRPGTAMGAYGRALGGPLAPEDVNALIALLARGGPPPIALPPTPVAGSATEGKVVYDSLARAATARRPRAPAPSTSRTRSCWRPRRTRSFATRWSTDARRRR